MKLAILALGNWTKKVEELHNTVKKKCLISSRIFWIKYTNPGSVWHDFTKMAVSSLILVRFSKFEIWHAQGSDADQSVFTIMSRATWRARWRRTRDIIDLVTEAVSLYATWSLVTVAPVFSLIQWLGITSQTEMGLISPKIVRLGWFKKLDPLKKGWPIA